MDGTLSRRERKKRETRRRLMEASRKLFREKGYTSTTVEEITERADVAKGTFFNYFPSKEALLSQLTMWGIEKLSAALEVSRGAPQSPVARIKFLIRLLHEQIGHDARLNCRAFAVQLYHPPLPPHRQARRQLSGLMTDLVREAQACGEIRADLEAEMVSDMLRMSFFWKMAVHRQEDDGPPPVERLEQIIDLWMQGLAGPKWSGA